MLSCEEAKTVLEQAIHLLRYGSDSDEDLINLAVAENLERIRDSLSELYNAHIRMSWEDFPERMGK